MRGKAVLFYTTFLNHTRQIAMALKNELRFRDFSVDTIRIRRGMKVDLEGYDLAGFLTPVLGLFVAFVHPAGEMVKFMRDLRSTRGKPAFSLCIYTLNPGKSAKLMEEEMMKAGFTSLLSKAHPATDTSSDIDRFAAYVVSEYDKLVKKRGLNR